MIAQFKFTIKKMGNVYSAPIWPVPLRGIYLREFVRQTGASLVLGVRSDRLEKVPPVEPSCRSDIIVGQSAERVEFDKICGFEPDYGAKAHLWYIDDSCLERVDQIAGSVGLNGDVDILFFEKGLNKNEVLNAALKAEMDTCGKGCKSKGCLMSMHLHENDAMHVMSRRRDTVAALFYSFCKVSDSALSYASMRKGVSFAINRKSRTPAGVVVTSCNGMVYMRFLVGDSYTPGCVESILDWNLESGGVIRVADWHGVEIDPFAEPVPRTG